MILAYIDSASDQTLTWGQPQVPSRWPGQGDLLHLCHTMGPAEAAFFVMAGIVFLVWGLHQYRYLVMLNAALLGAGVGWSLGHNVNAAPICAIVGAVTLVAMAWRFMNYAVAVMGGIVGAVVGASIWRSTTLPPELCWAGALSGLILFGLLSFILFQGCVIVYMSLQGAMMLLMGIIGLACKYQDVTPQLAKTIKSQPYLMPLAVMIPAVIGLLFQHHHAGHTGGGGHGASSSGGGNSGAAAAKKK